MCGEQSGEAGVGATLPLRVGGKCGPTSADPVDLTATVRGFSPDHVQTGLSGGRGSLGPSAWIETPEGVHLILGMTIFLVFPFTRLVHVWSAPVEYFTRRYQVVRARR